MCVLVAACGIWLSDPGDRTWAPASGCGALATGPPDESLQFLKQKPKVIRST